MHTGKKGRSTTPPPTAAELDLEPIDISSIPPDVVRDRAQQSLSVLPPEERELAYDKILSDLQNAGINLGGVLLTLGIHASDLAELTPLDLGKLLRFIRLNRPDILMSMASSLTALIGGRQPFGRIKHVAEAA